MGDARRPVTGLNRLRLFVIALFLPAQAVPLLAQFITRDVSQYAHTAWLAREGAFRGSAYAATQVADGNLWIVTPFGLLRFDGTGFIPSVPKGGIELTNTHIERVLGATDGSLWIAGTGLFRLKDGEQTSISELAGSVVHALVQDHNGDIWAGARTGGAVNTLCRIRAASTECTTDKSKTFGIEIKNLFEDKAGNLWISSEKGLWRWAPGKPEFFPDGSASPGIALNTQDLMVATKKSKLSVASADADRLLTQIPLSMSDLIDSTFLTDHQGGLWIGTKGRGIIHSLHGRIDTYTPADGLSSETVYGLFEDHEEDIWAVTATGIDRFRQQAVTLVTTKQGLSSNAIYSLLSDGKTMWLAMEGVLDRVRGQEIKGLKSVDGVAFENISTMYKGTEGRILIATGPPHGVAWLENEHLKIQRVPLGVDTYIAAPDGADGVWISNRQSGLIHVPRSGKPTEILPWGLFGHKAAYTIAFDPVRKGLWLAFNRGDLVFFRDGETRESYRIEHTPLQNPKDLSVDADGTVWLGSNVGLSRLRNGAIATMNSRNGLPCDGEHWRQEDDQHAIWLELPCGVAKLAPGELERWSHDPNRHVNVEAFFDNLDGAPNSIFGGHYNPNVALTPDGRIAFGTPVGLAIIDPHQETRNLQKPPVHIDGIEADAQKFSVEKPISFAPKIHVVRIAYSALSFREPQKVRFRYKLEGYDTSWSEVLSTHEAVYTNLPPRKYTFRVIACNDSGIWNDVGDTLNFSVGAAYYQTRWFFVLCVATVAFLLWMAYHLRVRYLYQQLSNKIEVQTNERLNVSRDLHDTLLQGVQGLLLSFHALSEDPNVDETVKAKLVTLGDRAEEVVEEGRDKIRSLRFENQPIHGFAEEIAQVARRLHSQEFPAFDISVTGKEVPLNPLVYQEVCFICREALNNAFKHAGAQKVEVLVSFARSNFSVVIRDDGQGLQPDSIQAREMEGHWGIVGMRERAISIGAKIEFRKSFPERMQPGTSIVIDTPSSIAYVSTAK